MPPGRGLSIARWALREPLVLFFAVGGALFALAPRGERADQVHLSQRSLRSLEQAEARRLRVAELSAPAALRLRAQAVDDELLYREGLRLAVDRGDSVVRQRVIEKMLFLADDLAGAGRPVDDAELERYLEAHAAAFRRSTTVSFVQVFAAADAAPLERLRPTLPTGTTGEAAQPPAAGDAFPIGRRVVDAPIESIQKSYGAAVAAAAERLPPGEWSAPLRSSYGWHLIKVVARRDGGMPRLAEVRDDVRLAYLQERKQRATAELLERLRARYQVVIDDREGASPLRDPLAGPRGAD
jgi:hypothetical protein